MKDLTDIKLRFILLKCWLMVGDRLNCATLSIIYSASAYKSYCENNPLDILNKLILDKHSIKLIGLDSKYVLTLIKDVDAKKLKKHFEIYKKKNVKIQLLMACH